MNADQIRRLYDRPYAADYENRFIRSELGRSDAEFEVQVLRSLLKGGTTWLDVACGTGWFLAHFPEVSRTGVDLSPAMIELAQKANPGIRFFECDFREPVVEWNDGWGVVSCMWYAYGLVDSVREVQQVIGNLCDWVAPDGVLFLPYADPELIVQTAIPYRIENSPWSGRVEITGITWSYAEDDGAKVHAHMVCPQVPLLKSWLAARFESVEIIAYPPAMEGWEGVRKAFLCRSKKSLETLAR